MGEENSQISTHKDVPRPILSVYESVAKQGQVTRSSGRFVAITLPDRTVIYEWFTTETTISAIWDFIEAAKPEYKRSEFYLASPIASANGGRIGDDVVTLHDLRAFEKQSGARLGVESRCLLQVRMAK